MLTERGINLEVSDAVCERCRVAFLTDSTGGVAYPLKLVPAGPTQRGIGVTLIHADNPEQEPEVPYGFDKVASVKLWGDSGTLEIYAATPIEPGSVVYAYGYGWAGNAGSVILGWALTGTEYPGSWIEMIPNPNAD
jgi:hypothetical protein